MRYEFCSRRVLCGRTSYWAEASSYQALRLRRNQSNLLPGKGHQELLVKAPPPWDAAEVHRLRGSFSEPPSAEREFLAQAKALGNVSVTIHGIVQGQVKRDLLRNAHVLPAYVLRLRRPAINQHSRSLCFWLFGDDNRPQRGIRYVHPM